MGGGGARGHDPFEILQSFFGGSPFGGGGSSSGRRQRRVEEDVVHPMKVSLEDLYDGTSKKFLLSRCVMSQMQRKRVKIRLANEMCWLSRFGDESHDQASCSYDPAVSRCSSHAMTVGELARPSMIGIGAPSAKQKKLSREGPGSNS